jgi:hypothetical protein
VMLALVTDRSPQATRKAVDEGLMQP